MVVSMSKMLQLVPFYDVENYNAIIPCEKNYMWKIIMQ